MLLHPRQLLAALVLLIAVVPTSAATKLELIPLWPKDVPGEKGDIGAEKETTSNKITRFPT